MCRSCAGHSGDLWVCCRLPPFGTIFLIDAADPEDSRRMEVTSRPAGLCRTLKPYQFERYTTLQRPYKSRSHSPQATPTNKTNSSPTPQPSINSRRIIIYPVPAAQLNPFYANTERKRTSEPMKRRPRSNLPIPCPDYETRKIRKAVKP